MQKCIYSLKTASEANFQKQEHVIPACIGGKAKLPKGYVSDEVNEMFSKLELDFARNNLLISLNRVFFGPGKRGSLDPNKATESDIHIMGGHRW